jgi:signal transduction histidine kinase
MEATTQLNSVRSFSAADARERQARLYLTRVRPGVLVISLLITLIDELLDPASITASTWLTIAGFVAVQPLLLLALHATKDAGLTVGASLFLDGLLFVAILPFVASPTNAAASMVILVTAFSYFRTPRATAVFAAASATAITLIGPHIKHWNDPAPLPASAFTVLVTGLLLAYLADRMRDTEAQLAHVVGEQAQALERLGQIDRARDRLIANVSHELRTPLTATIGSVETLLRDDVEFTAGQRQQLLELARDGGRRLLALVEDLLTVGTTRPDSLELTPEPEQLAVLVHDAVAVIDPGAGRRLELDLHVDALVRVDRMRMLQVVTNLVVNAIRHGAGDIVVTTDVDQEHALIRVFDEGSGIRPEHLDELFLPFARFSTRTDSTGLGLAICRALVEAHGGAITYSRTADDRTCFTVELPLDHEALPG